MATNNFKWKYTLTENTYYWEETSYIPQIQVVGYYTNPNDIPDPSFTYYNKQIRLYYKDEYTYYLCSIENYSGTPLTETVNQINWEGGLDNVNKIYYNGTVVFKKNLPTISFSIYYSPSHDRISITYNASTTMETGTWTILYGTSRTNLNRTKILYLNYTYEVWTISDAINTFGTGMKTFYFKGLYDGEYTSLKSKSFTITAPASKQWVYITTYSSSEGALLDESGYDVYYSSTFSDIADIQMELSENFLPTTYSNGSLALVQNSYAEYYEYEIQEV